MVDTDARCYLHGYPTSEIHSRARREGADRTAAELRNSLAGLADFVKRANADREVSEWMERTYQHVLIDIVSPEVLP
jgi:hypothetical protein